VLAMGTIGKTEAADDPWSSKALHFPRRFVTDLLDSGMGRCAASCISRLSHASVVRIPVILR